MSVRTGPLTLETRQLHPVTVASRRWAYPVLLTGAVLLAAVVRMVGVSDNPPGFFTDEASVGYNAYTILQSGRDEHGQSWPILFRAFGEYKLPIYIYTLVPFIALLGLTEMAVRLASAAYGTLTVLTTYLLAGTLFRRRAVGLAAALFLAITPWHVHYSRTGFGELVSFPPFLTLALYLFLLGVRRSKLWLLSGVVFGLTLYTYRAAWVVVPALLVALAVIYRRELFVTNWRMALPSLGIVLLMAVPILLHLTSDSGERAQQAGLLNLELGTWQTVKTFMSQYISYFSFGFLFQHGDDGPVTRHYLPGFGQLYLMQLPLIALAILGSVVRPTRGKLIALALLALYPLSGALSVESPISSRTILGSVTFAMLAGYGVVLLVHGVGRLNRPYGQVAAGLAVAFVVVVAAIGSASYLGRYQSEYPKLSAGYWGWQAGPKEIVEYFLSVEDQYDQLIMDGEFNAPYMFFRFYAPGHCKRCVIGGADRYDPAKRQLFALRPQNLVPKYVYRTVHEIEYPNGERAFSLVEITERADEN